MKRFIFTLILGLFSITSYAQSTPVNHTNAIVEQQNEWGSFVWRVMRLEDRGVYYYYVYVHSNSYFRTKSDGINYDRAITYINNLNFYMYEIDNRGNRYNTVQVNVPYVMCDHQWTQKPVAWFYSRSPYNNFAISYSGVSPWDNSNHY